MLFKRKSLSISKKITLIYSTILFSILLIFGILLFSAISYINRSESLKELVSNATTIEGYVNKFILSDKLAFKELKLEYSIFYNVFDANKKLIFTNKSDLPHLKISIGSRIMNFHENGRGNDISITYINRNLNINGRIYYIQVAKSSAIYKEYGRTMVSSLIFTSILGIIICFLSGKYLSKKILKPIRDISDTVKEITSKNLDKRIPTDGPDDELKDLGDMFNSMIERLELDFEKQKRFVSDASHELRTPLSIIDLKVNMLNRWGKNDPELLSKSLYDIKAEAESMNKLIGNLLYLANSDRNALVLKTEKFYLVELIKELINETLLINSNYIITYNCQKDYILNAEYNSIKQVLRILIDNSIKFSSPPGNISIKAEAMEEGTLINVNDMGCGIPSEFLPYIFDRFYRVDKSRTKSTGGTGLGLAIAKQIIKNHNGTISAESKPSEGTKIEIYLPFLY